MYLGKIILQRKLAYEKHKILQEKQKKAKKAQIKKELEEKEEKEKKDKEKKKNDRLLKTYRHLLTKIKH